MTALGFTMAIGGVAGAAGSSSASPKSGGTITVGFDSPQAYTNDMPVLIAIAEGYFKKEGLNVKTVGFTAGSDAAKALISNSIQVQDGVGFDVVSADAAGATAQAFYGIAQRSDFALFVSKKSGVTSFSGLSGKSVAISGFGSYTDYLSKEVAAKEHLGSFNEAALHQTPAIVSSVLNGSVTSAWEPLELTPLFKGEVNVLPVSQLGLASQYSTLIANKSYISSHTAQLKKFAAAISQAIAWHQSHKSAAIALAVQKLGVPLPAAEQGYAAAKGVYVRGGAISRPGMDAMATAVPALKLGTKAPSLSQLISTAIVK
jgi:NitT/TauT family transport system substrate-binding protein